MAVNLLAFQQCLCLNSGSVGYHSVQNLRSHLLCLNLQIKIQKNTTLQFGLGVERLKVFEKRILIKNISTVGGNNRRVEKKNLMTRGGGASWFVIFTKCCYCNQWKQTRNAQFLQNVWRKSLRTRLFATYFTALGPYSLTAWVMYVFIVWPCGNSLTCF